MKRNLITAVIAALAMILTAVPAAGEGPFPPDAWEHTAQFSGDRLYASFEWASGDYAYLDVRGYDGTFKSYGVKGKGAVDQLVKAYFGTATCDPATGVLVERRLVGAVLSSNAGAPVYGSEVHDMHADIAVGGFESVYETADCIWEGRILRDEVPITATLAINGYFRTEQCRGRCYSVCEFIGSMSLMHNGNDLLDGIQYDAIMEGLGGNRRGDIYWWAPPG